MGTLSVGATVELGLDGSPATGIVRYVGPLHFAAGEWVGVELYGEGGKNDGSVKGERYFECEMGKGIFMRPTVLTIVEPRAPVAKPPNGTAATRKPSKPSTVTGAGVVRRTSVVADAAANKRLSTNAASPSPAPRSRPSSLMRVCWNCILLDFPNSCNSRPQNLQQNNYLQPPRVIVPLGPGPPQIRDLLL